MINEVIEFTRGAAHTMKLAPVSFRGFVEGVLAESRPGLAEKSVILECEGEPPDVTVLIDLARLPHVFCNLIGNAVDAMPSGGKVTLRFLVKPSEVITEVEDTGPGIAPEIVPRLFEPFATHGKRHGTGLGLSICKRIVEDHGGRLWFRNGPAIGATFSFSLLRQN
jgi:signal transduction histidine kinase